MAIVKLSGLISEIKGKLGGSCFQSSQGGLVLKNITAKCWKNTEFQSKSNSYLLKCQNEWFNLSQNKRNEWNAYALFQKISQFNNKNRICNGQQVFLKFNYYRLAYNMAILTDPVYYTPQFPIENISFYLSYDPTTFFFTITSWNSEFFIAMLISAPIPESINNPGSKLKLLPFTTLNQLDQPITTEYTTIFGKIPVTDDFIFCKFAVINKNCGLISPWNIAKYQVTDYSP